jgi:hypothetical protein
MCSLAISSSMRSRGERSLAPPLARRGAVHIRDVDDGQDRTCATAAMAGQPSPRALTGWRLLVCAVVSRDLLHRRRTHSRDARIACVSVSARAQLDQTIETHDQRQRRSSRRETLGFPAQAPVRTAPDEMIEKDESQRSRRDWQAGGSARRCSSRHESEAGPRGTCRAKRRSRARSGHASALLVDQCNTRHPAAGQGRGTVRRDARTRSPW